jgi:hypothetical protein
VRETRLTRLLSHSSSTSMTRPSLIQNPLADSFVHVHVCMCMVLYISISNEYLPAPGMRRPLSARAMPASDLTNLRFYFLRITSRRVHTWQNRTDAYINE